MANHGDLIQEEFSRQASGFEDREYSFGDTRVLNWIIENVPVRGSEIVLDVAGGTGQVARAYAELTRCATVLDLTKEMLERGKRRRTETERTICSFTRVTPPRCPSSTRPSTW